MKHRIKKWIGMALLLVMGITLGVHAEQPPSVCVSIPIRFSSEMSTEAIVTLRNRTNGNLIQTMTKTELETKKDGAILLTYTEPGTYEYAVTSESTQGEETCLADVAVLCDEEGNLNATLVLHWENASVKVDEIEFGKGEKPTPENPTPDQPTPSKPSTPTPGGSTPSTPSRPSTSQILGETSHFWYVPLLFMAAGIVVAFAGVCYKKRLQERSR